MFRDFQRLILKKTAEYKSSTWCRDMFQRKSQTTDRDYKKANIGVLAISG